MQPDNKGLLAAILTLLLTATPGLCSGFNSEDSVAELTEAVDLARDGRTARSEERVILLLVSQDHCPFCVQIKDEILGPMVRAGDFQEQLLIRELFIDMGTQVKDFQSRQRESAELAWEYGVGMTPTMLFLDPNGRELTDRMIGINTPEMFYHYVDQSIRRAIAELKRGTAH